MECAPGWVLQWEKMTRARQYLMTRQHACRQGDNFRSTCGWAQWVIAPRERQYRHWQCRRSAQQAGAFSCITQLVPESIRPYAYRLRQQIIEQRIAGLDAVDRCSAAMPPNEWPIHSLGCDTRVASRLISASKSPSTPSNSMATDPPNVAMSGCKLAAFMSVPGNRTNGMEFFTRRTPGAWPQATAALNNGRNSLAPALGHGSASTQAIAECVLFAD